MRPRILLPLALTLACLLPAVVDAESPLWLDIFIGDHNSDLRRVRAHRLDSIESARHIPGPASDHDSLLVTTRGGRTFAYGLDSLLGCELRTHVPVVYLTTDSAVDEIPSKEEYLEGRVALSAGLGYDSVAPLAMQIKGRGNSTWEMPKKPYRVKLNKKVSLCGLPKAKNYVLIANYIDGSLMRNVAAFEIARLMGCPFTNHAVPVDVVLNGIYRGSYFLTEKLGIGSASVDISEEEGLLLELDVAMDEAYCFTSPGFGLPVMVKDPDLDELAAEDTTMTAAERLEVIRRDFIRAEDAVGAADPDEWGQCFDMASVANYLLVFSVMGNWEFNHPKSLYIHRPAPGAKYVVGPIWDFDWTADHNDNYEPGIVYTPIIDNRTGGRFFRRMARSPQFMEIYRERWEVFKRDVWPAVRPMLDRYADVVEASAYANGELWHMQREDNKGVFTSTETFRANYRRLIRWIDARIEYMDHHPAYGLYE